MKTKLPPTTSHHIFTTMHLRKKISPSARTVTHSLLPHQRRTRPSLPLRSRPHPPTSVADPFSHTLASRTPFHTFLSFARHALFFLTLQPFVFSLLSFILSSIFILSLPSASFQSLLLKHVFLSSLILSLTQASFPSLLFVPFHPLSFLVFARASSFLLQLNSLLHSLALSLSLSLLLFITPFPPYDCNRVSLTFACFPLFGSRFVLKSGHVLLFLSFMTSSCSWFSDFEESERRRMRRENRDARPVEIGRERVRTPVGPSTRFAVNFLG